MKKTGNIILLLLVFNFVNAQVNTILTAPPTNSANGTTGVRAPNGNVAHTTMRACYFVPASELTTLSPTISSFGFVFTNTLVSAPASGTLTIYLQNTSASSYTLGTAWSTATVGMTQVYNGIYNLPTGSTATVVDLPFPSNFPYTPGDGLHVAYQYIGSNFAPNSAVYRAYTNSVVTAGATNNSNTMPAVETLSTTTFRPLFRFGTPNTFTNEIAVVSLNAPGKVSETTGTNHTVTATIFNGSNASVNNITVSLVATGANPYNTTSTISSLAAGASTDVAFAAYNPTVLGSSNLQVSIGSDENNLNNSLSWTQSVTCNIIGSNPASVTPLSYSAGVGFNTGSGKIYVRTSTTGSQTLTGVNIGISSTSSNGGNSIFAAVADNSGNIIATSNTVFIVPSMYDTFEYFSFSPPVPFTANTNYFVGMAQPAGNPGYFPLGATAASVAPITPTIYATQSFTGGAINVLTTNLGYFAIEPVFSSTLCTSVGLAEVNNLKPINVSVYPNPASNLVNVGIANANEKTSLELIDVLGKVVLIKNNLSENNEINLNTITKGIYFVRVKKDKEISITKLIVE